MIAALALAAAPLAGVHVPAVASGQHYVCFVQSFTPSMRTAPAAGIVIQGNDWLFDETLAALTHVARATATIAEGEMTLSAPVAAEPGAQFTARVGQEDGDSRVMVDWDAAVPEPHYSDVSSGLAVCKQAPHEAAQEKKS